MDNHKDYEGLFDWFFEEDDETIILNETIKLPFDELEEGFPI